MWVETPGGLSYRTVSEPGSIPESPASYHSASTPSSVPGPDGLSTSLDMIQSFERLCGLLHEKDRTLNTYSDVNEQAESIMHDLQVILELAWKQDTAMLQMQNTLSSEKSSKTDQKEADYGMRRFLRVRLKWCTIAPH